MSSSKPTAYSSSSGELKASHLKALLEISHEISDSLELKEVLLRITDKALELMRAEICSIMLMDNEKQSLRITMSQGLEPQVMALTEVPVGSSVSGWVAKNRKALFIKDIEKDPRFTRRNCEKYFTNSLIASPLICKGKLLGVINVNNKRTRKSFTEEDLELLKGFASLAAVALHNARLYDELQKVSLEIMHSFTSALWAKDPYTKEHSEHITHLVLAISTELGLWGQDLETIRQSCHLHDIGKIGIRDSVLNKPAKLTVEEWREMKLHPLIGSKIIRPLSFMAEVADIVEQEHERWDGRGYPFGLKGEDIHIGARIVALADAYDAITSDRCYHKGQDHEWAVSELNRCSGTQFDPKVVKAFNRVLSKGVSGINGQHPSEGTGSQQARSASRP